MCNRLGPLEICCDAPPYEVVRACKVRGFQSPLDVGWRHMNHVSKGAAERSSSFGTRLLRFLFRTGQSKKQVCVCGLPMPELKQYHLASHSENVGDYILGQCCGCRTIFWEEAVPLPAWMENGILG